MKMITINIDVTGGKDGDEILANRGVDIEVSDKDYKRLNYNILTRDLTNMLKQVCKQQGVVPKDLLFFS